MGDHTQTVPQRPRDPSYRRIINRQRLKHSVVRALLCLIVPAYFITQGRWPDQSIMPYFMPLFAIVIGINIICYRSQKCPRCHKGIGYLPAEGGFPNNELCWEITECPHCGANYRMFKKAKLMGSGKSRPA